MNKIRRCLLPIAALALATLACQLVTGETERNTPDPTETESSIPTEAPISLPTEGPPGTGTVLLSDDFRSGGWGTGTDANSSIEYANGALQFMVFTKNWFVWSTPNKDIFQDVHIEVTVINNNTDPTTAFGVMCNLQQGEDSFYYFTITPAGQYAIAKAKSGEKDVFLTNNDKWALSDLIAKNAASYRLGADCGPGTLRLYVEGQQVAEVSDMSYTQGSVGLMVWSGEEATNTNVAFDDFLMTELP